jgi:hypothetical protein
VPGRRHRHCESPLVPAETHRHTAPIPSDTEQRKNAHTRSVWLRSAPHAHATPHYDAQLLTPHDNTPCPPARWRRPARPYQRQGGLARRLCVDPRSRLSCAGAGARGTRHPPLGQVALLTVGCVCVCVGRQRWLSCSNYDDCISSCVSLLARVGSISPTRRHARRKKIVSARVCAVGVCCVQAAPIIVDA